ncbi:MAG: hypothetical protein AAF249_11285 [Pseudomonadota bacterium]
MKNTVRGCALRLGAALLFAGPTLASCSEQSAGQALEPTLETKEQLARIEAMARTGPKGPQFDNRFAPLDPKAEPRISGAPVTAGLPTSPSGGHDLIVAYCSYCHSTDIIVQQRLSRKKWEQLLLWMSEKQGMPKLHEKDQTVLLEYLANNFGNSLDETQTWKRSN